MHHYPATRHFVSHMVLVPNSANDTKRRIGGKLVDFFKPKSWIFKTHEDTIKTLDGVDYKRISWKNCEGLEKFRERNTWWNLVNRAC